MPLRIRLVKRTTEQAPDIKSLLAQLESLYSDDVRFIYDDVQKAVVVKKSGRTLGSVRAEGALHTIIWGALALAEREV